MLGWVEVMHWHHWYQHIIKSTCPASLSTRFASRSDAAANQV